MASKFQVKTIKEYKKLGYRVVNLSKTNDNGITDLMCLKDGKSVFVECKEADDTLKPLQKYKIDELVKMGFEAICIQDGKGQVYPVSKNYCKCNFPFSDCNNAMEAPHGDKWYCRLK